MTKGRKNNTFKLSLQLHSMTKTINHVTDEKLEKYFAITKEAYEHAKMAPEKLVISQQTRKDFLTMIACYINDAEHFAKKGEIVTAFAALNYAHGWLDAGACIGIFDVHDNRLFTRD